MRKRLHCRNILRLVQESAANRLNADRNAVAESNSSPKTAANSPYVQQRRVTGETLPSAGQNGAAKSGRTKPTKPTSAPVNEENQAPTKDANVLTASGERGAKAYASLIDDAAIVLGEGGVNRKHKRSRIQRLWKRLSGGAVSG